MREGYISIAPNNLDATDYAEKSRLESAGFDTDFAK